MSFLTRFFDGVQRDLRIFFFVLILLEIYRAAFIWLMADYMAAGTTSEQIETALWAGLRLSLKTAGAVTAVTIVFVTIFGLSPRFRLATGILATLIFSILFMLRFPYFRAFHSTFGMEVLNGLNDDWWAIIVTAVQEYGLIWRLPVALILTILGIAVISRLLLIKTVPLPKLDGTFDKIVFTVPLILAIGIFSVFVRFGGSLTYANGINWENAAVTPDNFLNECILDDGQALYRTYSMAKYVGDGSISGVDADNIQASAEFISARKNLDSKNLAAFLEKTAAGARIDKPAHIFIILGETFMQWPMLGKYSNLGVADGIKSLVAEENAYYSRNFLSTSDFTSGSICGMVTGLPDLKTHINYLPKTYEGAYISAMAPIFHELGYRVDFWYSGAPSWDNIAKMSAAQGFDNFYGYPNLNAPKQTVWGAKDEYLFAALENHLAEEPPTVHLIMTTTNHPPYNLNLAQEGFDFEKTLAEVRRLPNVPDAETLTTELGHYWYMDKSVTNFVRRVSEKFPASVFVITGDHAVRCDPNTHPTIFEHQSVPFVLYGAGIDKNILPPDVVGEHISIVPTLVELIAPEGFKYHSIAPSLFDSDGVAFNNGVFLTQKIAGEIDADVVELLPHVASADLDTVNLAAERDAAEKVISAMRTVGWWILNRGRDF